MKKNGIFIALIFALGWQSGIAQFSIGPRAGVSLGRITTPTIIDLVAPDFQYLPGIEWGATGEYAFSDKFALMVEMIYREKGFRVAESTAVNVFNIDLPLGVRVDTRLRYIDVPIMAKYSIGNGPIRAFVAAGPQIGYAMNGRIKTKANLLFDFNLTNIPINLSGLNHRRFDVGGVAVAGVEFDTGQGKLFFDARYQHGFLDAFKVPLVELDIRNHGFGFGVGYKFQL